MKEEKKEIKEEIIEDFYGEKKPNGTKKLIIIVTIAIIGLIISLIMLHKSPEEEQSQQGNNSHENNNQENPNEINTPNDDIIISTNSDDMFEENEEENIEKEIVDLNIEIALTEEQSITGVQYVLDKNQYINERKLDLWARYVNNNESEILEVDDILLIENGKLSYQYSGIKYILQEFNNIKKAAGYFSAESGETIFFITNDNKLYEINGIASEYNDTKLTKIKINNVDDVIILERCTESCYTSSIIIKTTDNKYYDYDNEYIKELVIDETKIEKIEKEYTTIRNIKEIKKEEKQEIDESSWHVYYPITNERDEYINSEIFSLEKYTSIVLNNGNLNIYAPDKMMIYNNPNIEKYMIIEKGKTNEYSIFFVTKQKEIYRMYFENQELKSFIKYDISNVKYLDLNYEDEEEKTILVRTKNEDYMLDYKEDIIYKIKY